MACDPAPITVADVASWFANCRGTKPSFETYAEIARRLDGPLSVQWQAYSLEQVSGSSNDVDGFEYWDFAEIRFALKSLNKALPRVEEHWNNVSDCEDAVSARSALTTLAVALKNSARFIDHPFGEGRKNHRKKAKDWHVPAIFILRTVRESLRTVRTDPIKFSANSPSIKVTQLALERLGYGKIELATVAAHADRFYDRYGDPMVKNTDLPDLLPFEARADR